MNEESGVHITLKDVYDKVTVLSALMAPLVDPEVGVVAAQKDHEVRLRELEQDTVTKADMIRQRNSLLTGIGLVVAAVGGAIGLIQAVAGG